MADQYPRSQTPAQSAPPSSQAPATAPAHGSQPPEANSPPDVSRTRTSATYAAIGAGLLVLIVVIIFFAQNLHETSVHFITLRFRLPTGVVVLASAVAGGLVVLFVSLARVVQLRRANRRSRKALAAR